MHLYLKAAKNIVQIFKMNFGLLLSLTNNTWTPLYIIASHKIPSPLLLPLTLAFFFSFSLSIFMSFSIFLFSCYCLLWECIWVLFMVLACCCYLLAFFFFFLIRRSCCPNHILILQLIKLAYNLCKVWKKLYINT